jgi:hypothetical protein
MLPFTAQQSPPTRPGSIPVSRIPREELPQVTESACASPGAARVAAAANIAAILFNLASISNPPV